MAVGELISSAGTAVPPTAVAIANRHEIASAGLGALLEAGGHRVVARCSCESDLLHSVETSRPDIIILADNIVCQEPAKTVLQLRARYRSVAIILMLDEHDAVTAAGLVSLGVEGILLSAGRARSVIDCVESVYRGRRWIDPDLLCHLAVAEQRTQNGTCLTCREAEIAQFVSRGLSNKEIARELNLCEGTVKMHLHHIYERLHLSGRTHLARRWLEDAEMASLKGRRNKEAIGSDAVIGARFAAGHT
ncbi:MULTISPECIES: response regulator transcription factor [unclassified Sinorhizobium]|uniref:response regulator transcription factor n=1 Tax=unclassified Sinorhizobium TaxID=2613772 RepID=UPI0024C267F7|nr:MULTISPECIES: response regulator transcription factor [unclassified Sinorhizobium]MDK1374737.1 response regulator transcription factor [Sinorhizobium sp. 6-70]MDK1479079.1 response regulator transcription factor [Sinorhizobium sp. 6-117]